MKTSDQDEITDILTNLLACSSNYPQSVQSVLSLVQNMSSQQTYEFYFNLAQVQMKEQLFQDSMRTLLKSYEMAKEDGSEQQDQTRFKVQEIHQLTGFYHELNLIEYGSQLKINLNKSLIHENLVELNMNAFAEVFESKKDQVKELIGNLNWRKLNERIKQQLEKNQNLTTEQKKLMEINQIVSLLRSHQFEEARKEWERISGHNDHQALKGIGAYFFIKDHKYDDALNLIKNKKDIYSIFLKSQILLSKKEHVAAIENLIENMDKQLLENDEFLMFLIKLSLNHKAQSHANKLIDLAIKQKDVKKNKELLLFISDIYLKEDKREESLKILKTLYDAHGNESKEVQAKYLNLLSDLNIAEASKIQSKLPVPLGQDVLDDDEYLQQLIEEGMPEKKKEKKTKDVVQQTKGGAEIFIPKKRKNQVRYPKNFDPKNPGPEPDPERWLPKWQRSRFKKRIKKFKGAQGDAQIDTDVTGGIGKSTAHKEVEHDKKGAKRRKK